MVKYKTKEEIETMMRGGKKLRKVVGKLIDFITSGIRTEQIDKLAGKLITEEGGEPSFKKVKDYHWGTCLPINEQVVHTPPSSRTLKSGNLLTLDIGMYYQGFHTDYATSLIVGSQTNTDKTKFLAVGKKTLDKAIQKTKAGAYLGDVSKTIQDEIYSQGYYVLKTLTGHGIGRDLHEDPFVPGYLDKPISKTLKIKPGLVLAIEIIYSKGTEEIAYEQGNSWSIITKDHSLSACFEETIAVLPERTLVLT